MNAKGLKKRIEKIEEAMEPSVEEALAWVEQRNSLAGRVLRKAVEIKAESEHFVRFPTDRNLTLAEWEEQCAALDKAKAERDAETNSIIDSGNDHRPG